MFTFIIYIIILQVYITEATLKIRIQRRRVKTANYRASPLSRNTSILEST
jgi:hypothetical protein